jgi:diguanylate cyclase (GGDEF)-like protein/PAS domain S-box-containing protein
LADSKPTFAALVQHGRDAQIISMPEADRDAYFRERVRLVRAADPTPIDIKLADGGCVRFECALLPNGGRMLSWINVTDLVRHAEEMDQYRLLAANAGDVVVRLGLDGARQYVSPAMERVLGWAPGDLLGTKPSDMMDGDSAAEWERLMAALRDGMDDAMLISRLHHKDGRYIWIESTLKLVRDPETGVPSEIVAVLRDVSKRKAAEEALQAANETLQQLASTDGLTGLSNRRTFDNALKRECRRAERAGQQVALVMIDVDRFKNYNDHYGHQQGDDCLRQVAQTVVTTFRRPGDLAARYGGEEFVVILPETDELGAMYVAERFRSAVQTLGIEHGGNEFGVATISLGVACSNSEGEIDRATLVRHADEALYEAKRTGRNKVVCWSDLQAQSKVA